ncbi:MAG: hypothetical protein CSA36_06740 [Draconibacterium sp.]|nr:MAG: hypothetical protein CSA36_06740 [Draconibacterium sp.]
MHFEGNLLKMRTELTDPIHYYLALSNEEIAMNDLIGKKITMRFNGRINCISCGEKTKTSFNQGFCYNCLQTAPEASESVVRPELSKAHLGIARDMGWAEKHDLIDHIVYLALSTKVKVGVTRHHQIPTRWIDQGANAAIKVALTPNRHIAGVIEVFLKRFYTDKTNWRTMLTHEKLNDSNLMEEKKAAIDRLPAELQKYISNDDKTTSIRYPLLTVPEKVNSIGFDKKPTISNVLTGIKGQYLIFENNTVLNIRKHNGYFIELEF